jgi:hypothetical protein
MSETDAFAEGIAGASTLGTPLSMAGGGSVKGRGSAGDSALRPIGGMGAGVGRAWRRFCVRMSVQEQERAHVMAKA